MVHMKKVDPVECSKVTGGSMGVGGAGGMLDTAGTWASLSGADRAALQQAKPKDTALETAIDAFHTANGIPVGGA